MKQLLKGKTFQRITTALSVGLVLFCFSGAVYAEDFNAEIAALKAQAAEQQASAGQLQSVANDYQSKVSQLQGQINSLQTQININQLQYDQLSAQIADNEVKLDTAKAALGADLKNMYITGNETPLEMLASSQSLGDYFNQQQYQDSVKDKIQGAMSAIISLQQQLDDQQKQVGALLGSENTQKQQLADNQAQINALLAAAQQSAGAANQLLASTNSQLSQKEAQQAALLAAASEGHGSMGGSGGACDNGHGNGGYKASWCNAAQDSIQTPSGLNRECVSWAGFRWPAFGGPANVNWGNANTWDDNARRAGYVVNNTPAVGAVAQTDAGAFGHVGIVEAISGDNVEVSEMNYDGFGHFDVGTYSSSYFKYIHP